MSIGQRAWEICIKNEMTKKNITSDREVSIYLVNYIQSLPPLGNEPMGFGPIKSTAAKAILETQSEATLKSIVNEFEEEFKNEPLGPKEAPLTKRHEKLRDRISLLRAMLKNKTEKRTEK